MIFWPVFAVTQAHESKGLTRDPGDRVQAWMPGGGPVLQPVFLFQSAICWLTKALRPLRRATLASIALYCAR